MFRTLFFYAQTHLISMKKLLFVSLLALIGLLAACEAPASSDATTATAAIDTTAADVETDTTTTDLDEAESELESSEEDAAKKLDDLD